MFINNKYTKWYNQIINRAQLRKTDDYDYTELHHIIPKSIGGTNSIKNLIRLTAREHFICHLLLTKMTDNQHRFKMVTACWAMSSLKNQYHHRYKINSKTYESLKIQMSKVKSELYKKEGNPFFGKEHSEETKRKIREMASRPKSEKWKASASRNRKGEGNSFFGKKHAEESKKKMGKSFPGSLNGFFGKQHSLEQREKKRQEKLNSPRLSCPHCSKIVDIMNFKRWHDERCKFKK